MAKYNLHAGHAAIGKGAIGAVGILSESIEDRIIKDKVIAFLTNMGHTVYDCTVDTGNQSQVLNGIVKKCNSHKVDLDVSIHFNSGANRPYKDGVTTGTEVFCYDPKSTNAVNAANRIANGIANIGFKNRGVKYRRDLAVLANTNAQALLIEVCFVDDGDDADLYRENTDRIAKAIAEGITGSAIVIPSEVPKPAAVDGGVYRLYNPNAGDHFFTVFENERDSLMSAGWGYEGVSWIAPKLSNIPVYRAYNPNNGKHLFTANKDEFDGLIHVGWNDEGIAFYSDENKHTPVYRVYNENSGEHFFSANRLEVGNLVHLGWHDEGVAFYGI